MPLRQFGILIAIAMITSGVGALSLLPALMLSAPAAFMGKAVGEASRSPAGERGNQPRRKKETFHEKDKHYHRPGSRFLSGGAAVPALAQDSGLTAAQILDKVDDAINGPKDQSYTVHLVLTDKDGSQKTREMMMLQKGREKRLVRFTAPADQRGIAFLSLPGDLQYLYLPGLQQGAQDRHFREKHEVRRDGLHL